MLLFSSLLLSVYVFFFSLCSAFFFLCSSSVFLGWFFGSVFFLFLIFHSFSISSVLFFFCSVFLLSVFALFFGFLFLPVLGFLLPFIETHSLPLISPAFAKLYLPRTRSWARDVVHDWICCRFSGLRLNRDEEDHTALPLATATFRSKDIFLLFDPWTLEIRQLNP